MPTAAFRFEVLARDGQARRGRLVTPRAVIETPLFMPVGTQGTVKSQTPEEVEASGSRIVLANTYHLMLRPGAELVAQLGGLHRFMGWPHALLTDSGGFQVFSIAKLRRIDDDGVTFRNHLDGSEHRLTPERSMQVQALLGSDIAMVLDECPPGDADRPTIERAIERTTAWAQRCLAVNAPPGQARFGIVQGGVHADLRLAHLQRVAEMPFDGVAMGGFSVGEPVEQMYDGLAEVGPAMPADRPRYLMGVGRPVDLLRAIGSGIDMFDCTIPTRNGRNGQALTWQGRVNIKQARHLREDAPLDAGCGCPVCNRYSRAYLRHLALAGEMLMGRLLTQHNLHFYQQLMAAAGRAIRQGDYDRFAHGTEARLAEGDEVG